MAMDSLIEPNLNADVYRDMTAADRVPVPDKHLQFILIFNEESAILGGSNMTDRYWSGTVWYYNNIADFNRDKAFVATKTESGVCSGAYIEEKKFVVGEDSGVLQVFCLTESANTNLQELQCLGYACQHDDSLLTVSVFPNDTHLVTGGMDCCIKVWDITDLIAMQSFSFAHTDIVTCVDVQPANSSVFVSTSLDHEALLWDIRQSKPAKSIFRKSDCGLTAVAWNAIQDHTVTIGATDGSITLLDVRKGDASVLYKSEVFSRPVHKLLFNPDSERSKQLACCADDISVKVIDIDKELSVIFKDDTHTDFVRGLAWHKDKLLSCSWDYNVVEHVI